MSQRIVLRFNMVNVIKYFMELHNRGGRQLFDNRIFQIYVLFKINLQKMFTGVSAIHWKGVFSITSNI
jgi:hypothetical protein